MPFDFLRKNAPAPKKKATKAQRARRREVIEEPEDLDDEDEEAADLECSVCGADDLDAVIRIHLPELKEPDEDEPPWIGLCGSCVGQMAAGFLKMRVRASHESLMGLTLGEAFEALSG